MAIIDFGNSFISPWKKWALKQIGEEEESSPDMSASSQSSGWDDGWGGGMGFEPLPPAPAPGFGAAVGDVFADWGANEWSAPIDDYVAPYTPPPATS